MRKFALLLVFMSILILALGAFAQTPQPVNVYAAGVSFNSGASPSVAGTALYAHLLSDGSGTYAYSVFDALPTTLKPFTVTNNVGAGIAQKLFSIGNVPIYVPTAAGISWNGSNTGWQWSTGALASIKLKGNWRIMPNVRLVKSSVSNGDGYRPMFGVLFGWGG